MTKRNLGSILDAHSDLEHLWEEGEPDPKTLVPCAHFLELVRDFGKRGDVLTPGEVVALFEVFQEGAIQANFSLVNLRKEISLNQVWLYTMWVSNFYSSNAVSPTDISGLDQIEATIREAATLSAGALSISKGVFS